MKILVRTLNGPPLQAFGAAADALEAEVSVIEPGGSDSEGNDPALSGALRNHPDLMLMAAGDAGELRRVREATRARGVALAIACASTEDAEQAAAAGADEWAMVSASEAELVARFRSAVQRARNVDRPELAAAVAEHLQYEELLYDRFTGFPTLPLMLERAREILERSGRLTLLYIEFVRYSKLEEIYGWQKLDEVLQSTADAVREFYDRQRGVQQSLLMVSHAGDDDFIFFTDLPETLDQVERRINELAKGLEGHVHERLERNHGTDIASLFDIYIGSTTVFRNPKIRTERMIYRGIREAAQAARSVEHRERSRKVADLKETLREGGVYVEYHPIVVTATREVFGFEALARGSRRSMRSPQILFGVAEEANLIWELSRLCRQRAVEGMATHLNANQLLFINVDPHDFRDPAFRSMSARDLGIEHPDRVVLEITERTAITDYPAFQVYLKEFRDQGFRFAVDDAGSGYAGLGSIANLGPDFIKLDISLISDIDTNFMKQNLVETMVSFANEHGIKVIAEGVEREDEYETVRGLGVHLTQGFLFHTPEYMGKPAHG